MMEVYAAYLEQTDHNIGRVIEAIEQTGQLENTLVIYIVGDNGASAEGSMQGLLNEMTFFNGVPEDLKQVLKRADEIGTWKTYNHYPVGWAHAMCTPFQWTKQVASHYGGTRNGMVISWPKGIKAKGELRTQWHHCIDIVPTILEAGGVDAPVVGQRRDAKADRRGEHGLHIRRRRRHRARRTTQYFEMLGNAAIYHDGWVACTTPPIPPWDPNSADVDRDHRIRWELYDVDKGLLPGRRPGGERCRRSSRTCSSVSTRRRPSTTCCRSTTARPARMDPAIRPSLTRGRKSFTFYEGMSRIPEGASPDIKNKSCSITRPGRSDGRKRDGDDHHAGRPVRRLWAVSRERKAGFPLQLRRRGPLRDCRQGCARAGKHTVKVDFAFDGGGIGKGGTAVLSVDGKEVAKGRIGHTIPVRISLDESLDIGEDTGTPVDHSYDVPFRFPGKIEKVTIDLK